MKPKRKRRTKKEKENLDQIWLRFGLVFSPDSRVMVKAPFSVSLSLFFLSCFLSPSYWRLSNPHAATMSVSLFRKRISSQRGDGLYENGSNSLGWYHCIWHWNKNPPFKTVCGFCRVLCTESNEKTHTHTYIEKLSMVSRPESRRV